MNARFGRLTRFSDATSRRSSLPSPARLHQAGPGPTPRRSAGQCGCRAAVRPPVGRKERRRNWLRPCCVRWAAACKTPAMRRRSLHPHSVPPRSQARSQRHDHLAHANWPPTRPATRNICRRPLCWTQLNNPPLNLLHRGSTRRGKAPKNSPPALRGEMSDRGGRPRMPRYSHAGASGPQPPSAFGISPRLAGGELFRALLGVPRTERLCDAADLTSSAIPSLIRTCMRMWRSPSPINPLVAALNCLSPNSSPTIRTDQTDQG